MKKIQRLGFWAFIAYLPILILILGWLAPSKHHGFSFKTHWISTLGAKSSPAYLFLFIGLNLFSFLGIFFIIQLASRAPNHSVSKLLLFFLIICLLVISLITFFPMDTQWILKQKGTTF